MASSAEEQQEQKNKDIVHQFFEAFDRHDIEKMEQLVLSTNYSLHFPTMPLLDWNGQTCNRYHPQSITRHSS